MFRSQTLGFETTPFGVVMARRSWVGRLVLIALALASGVGVTAPAARAAVWDDDIGNEAWHIMNNWSPNFLPGATEAVTFPTPIPNFLPIISLTGNGTSTFEVAGSLTFDANYTLQSGA